MARWIRRELPLSSAQARTLIDGIDALLHRQECLWERSKAEAISALVEGFRTKIARLQQELSARDVTARNVAQYFDCLVAELSERASQDPKTRLTNFTRFLERLDIYLALEQRGRWCAVGLVDIRGFKQYNDTLGHSVGDRIIEGVARLLQEHVRAADLVARDVGRELHARFGGDEFCFLIPNLEDAAAAEAIADRFRHAVAQHDWAAEDARLAQRPVAVDVGVACLMMDSISNRRRMGPELGRQLVTEADRMMYAAKTADAPHTYAVRLRIAQAALVPLDPANPAPHP